MFFGFLAYLINHMASCWQDGQQTKNVKKTTPVFQWFWAPRPANLEAKMAPKSVPFGGLVGSWGLLGAKMAPRPLKMAPRPPKRAQDGPQIASKWPSDPFKRANLEPCWQNLEPNKPHDHPILGTVAGCWPEGQLDIYIYIYMHMYVCMYKK